MSIPSSNQAPSRSRPIVINGVNGSDQLDEPYSLPPMRVTNVTSTSAVMETTEERSQFSVLRLLGVVMLMAAVALFVIVGTGTIGTGFMMIPIILTVLAFSFMVLPRFSSSDGSSSDVFMRYIPDLNQNQDPDINQDVLFNPYADIGSMMALPSYEQSVNGSMDDPPPAYTPPLANDMYPTGESLDYPNEPPPSYEEAQQMPSLTPPSARLGGQRLNFSTTRGVGSENSDEAPDLETGVNTQTNDTRL